MRLLDDHKVEYESVDLRLKEAASADVVPSMLGASVESVFKTLCTRADDGEVLVFMVPANGHLSLKKAAHAAGKKHVEMLLQKDLLPTTGYVHGGCSPLAMKKSYRTWMDESALNFDAIYFSGGKIGVQIQTDPRLLQQTFSFETAPLLME